MRCVHISCVTTNLSAQCSQWLSTRQEEEASEEPDGDWEELNDANMFSEVVGSGASSSSGLAAPMGSAPSFGIRRWRTSLLLYPERYKQQGEDTKKDEPTKIEKPEEEEKKKEQAKPNTYSSPDSSSSDEDDEDEGSESSSAKPLVAPKQAKTKSKAKSKSKSKPKSKSKAKAAAKRPLRDSTPPSSKKPRRKSL